MKREPVLSKYTYFAAAGQGPPVEMFALFSPREPTAEEVAEFLRGVAIQTKQLAIPRPSFFTVEPMYAMPIEVAAN